MQNTQPPFQVVWNGMDGQQQYTTVPTMPVIENTIPETPHELLNEKWSSGLCDCCGKDCRCGDDCNCGTCCLAGCWSSLQMGWTLEHLGLVSSSIVPILVHTCAEVLLIRSLLLLSSVTLRRSLVNKLGRKEDPCYSCCAMCCCFPCAIAQIERDTIAHNYKFNPTKLDKSNYQSCIDVTASCCGGISNDSVPRARDPRRKLGTPFTKNSMFRYYTRIPTDS